MMARPVRKEAAVQITYIGHATLLLEIGGARVLTDPNFDPSWAGFCRACRAPGIALEPADARRAPADARARRPPVLRFARPAAARHPALCAAGRSRGGCRRRGYAHADRARAGETANVGARYASTPPRDAHGNRYGFDRWRSATQHVSARRRRESVFFAGDTALDADTHQLVERVSGSAAGSSTSRCCRSAMRRGGSPASGEDI